MTNQEALKPCPFCGGEAVIAVDEKICRNGDLLNEIIIQCCLCGAVMIGDCYQFNNRIFTRKAIKQVREAWNTRVKEGV